MTKQFPSLKVLLSHICDHLVITWRLSPAPGSMINSISDQGECRTPLGIHLGVQHLVSLALVPTLTLHSWIWSMDSYLMHFDQPVPMTQKFHTCILSYTCTPKLLPTSAFSGSEACLDITRTCRDQTPLLLVKSKVNLACSVLKSSKSICFNSVDRPRFVT